MEGVFSKEDVVVKVIQIIFEYGFVWIVIFFVDFNVIGNLVVDGIIVMCWYNDVLNFVGKDEGGNINMLEKVLFGRSKRDEDG